MDNVSYTTNHNVNYYMRNAYRGNTNALREDYRGSQPKAKIIPADAKAVRRMTEKLSSLEYDSDHGVDVLQNAKAFVKAYNNLIESTDDNQDSRLNFLKKKLTKLIKNNKDDLALIGIDLKGDGRLSLDEDTFGAARPARIEEILSSKGNISASLRSIVNKIYRQSGKLSVYNASGEKTAQDTQDSGKSVDFSL